MNEPLFWIYAYLFIAAVHFCAILPTVIRVDQESEDHDLLSDNERKAVIFLTTFLNAIFWPLLVAMYLTELVKGSGRK